jgi:hypothetical protein
MATSKLERFSKLVALASSPNDNEARNAALTAVRMLAQGGSIVVLSSDDPRCELPAIRPGEPGWQETAWGVIVEQEVMARFERMRQAFLAAQPPPHPKPSEPGWDSSPGGRYAHEEVAKQMRAQTELLRRAGRATPEMMSSVNGGRSKGAGDGQRRSLGLSGWMKINNSYQGPCKGMCGEMQPIGVPIYWRRGAGIMCVTCCEAASRAVAEGGLLGDVHGRQSFFWDWRV